MWGGVKVASESTLVRALSRFPGTTSYQEYDREILHTNSSAAACDGWTYVKLSSSGGDKIQWLWIDGTLAIDDLKIARQPLTCIPSSVQRGQQVTCTVTANWSVTGWEFQPDSANTPPVQETSSSREWKGVAAAPGRVAVQVTDGTNTRVFKVPLKVTNRSSPWRSQWGYREGPELTVGEHEPGLGLVEGRNCPEAQATEAECIDNPGWVQPHPFIEPDAGFTVVRISSGPNRGYWYVNNIRFNMRRVGNVNPGLLVTSPRKHLVPSSDLTRECKRSFGLSQKATVAFANMNQHNQFCALDGADMTVWIPAARGHEGRGYNGGVGHQTLAEAAAGEPQNDPYAAIEPLVKTDSSLLVGQARVTAHLIGERILEHTLDDNPINGGPQGNHPADRIWFWEPDLTWRPYNLEGF